MNRKYTITGRKNAVKIRSKGGAHITVSEKKTPVIRIGRGVQIVINRGISGDPAYSSPSLISIVNGTTYNIPAGKSLVGIGFAPFAGNRICSVGYTAGATQVLDAEEIPSNQSHRPALSIYFHTAQTLHFSGFTGSVRIYLL